MTLGLKAEFRQMRKSLDAANRYTDIAVQFEVYRPGPGGPGPFGTFPTGRKSPVYGGRWDKWTRRYVGEAKPWTFACTERQFELVTCNARRIEANGGRGSGKSEGGVLRVLRHIAERPRQKGQVVSPTYDLTEEIWEKMLQQVPAGWLMPGKKGIQRARRKLRFQNGAQVRFRSANEPDSLRSWGGGWTFVDEEQDVSTLAIGVIVPSLRCSAPWHTSLWTVGTPKHGDYKDRHEKLVKQIEGGDITRKLLKFGSYTNIFVDPESFDESKKEMHKALYDMEIGAEWPKGIDSVYVARLEFDARNHRWDYPDIATDITRQFTKRKLGVAADYIHSVDYGEDTPNVAWTYKVFSGARPVWVVWEVTIAEGHSSKLAEALKDIGMGPRVSVVIDDASGEYNTYAGKRGPYSSAALMRQAGWRGRLFHPQMNPKIKERVNSLLCKLDPVKGPARWFYVPKLEEHVNYIMRNQKWKGEGLDKAPPSDGLPPTTEDFDAATYGLHFLDPAAAVSRPGVRGVRT